MREMADVIKGLREEKHLSQAQLADELKVSRASISMWELGQREPSLDMKELICDYFNIDMNYLHGKTSVRNVYRDGNEVGFKIPVLGYVAGGVPIEAITDIIDYEELPIAMKSKGEYFGLKIKGYSMEPKIEDGDIVIVKKQEQVENGAIAIVTVNGDEATCKKVAIREDGLMLIPLNNDYEPIFFSSEDVINKPVKIIGRVIEIRRKL